MEDTVMKADLSAEIRRKDLEIEELRRHITSMEHILKENDDAVDILTVNQKFCDCEPGKPIVVDGTRSGPPGRITIRPDKPTYSTQHLTKQNNCTVLLVRATARLQAVVNKFRYWLPGSGRINRGAVKPRLDMRGSTVFGISLELVECPLYTTTAHDVAVVMGEQSASREFMLAPVKCEKNHFIFDSTQAEIQITTLEDHLRKQVADMNKQQPHEVEVTLRAQIRDLQYAVKDLTEERAGLEKIIAQKTLELDQRDLVFKQHSQILRSKDELIPLIQNRKRYDEECLEKLRGFVFEHEKTYFNREMDNRFNSNDQYAYESANAVDKPYAFDPTMVDKEMSFRQEKMTELFNLLEQKQMEMMRLERRMRDLQGAQDQREKTVREQAACITSLQKALGAPNTNKSRGYIMSKKPSGSEYRKRVRERNERESALLNKIHRLDDFFNKPETPSCSAETLPVVTGTERNVVSEDSGVIVEVEVIQQPASATATDVSDTTTEIAPVHVPSPPSTEQIADLGHQLQDCVPANKEVTDSKS
ncbi:hypothetical protein J6590_025855 [Homalodisca vitripennis]|nr:hypothetical protein J6590_025855 [Homalodisca vitripennis]